jgi:hypothetical protein
MAVLHVVATAQAGHMGDANLTASATRKKEHM